MNLQIFISKKYHLWTTVILIKYRKNHFGCKIRDIGLDQIKYVTLNHSLGFLIFCCVFLSFFFLHSFLRGCVWSGVDLCVCVIVFISFIFPPFLCVSCGVVCVGEFLLRYKIALS